MTIKKRLYRHLTISLIYSSIAAISVTFGFILRFEFDPDLDEWAKLLYVLPIIIAIKLVAIMAYRQFESLLCYFSVPDFLKIVQAGLVSSVALLVLWYITGGQLSPPRSVLIIDSIFFIGLVSVSRLAWRQYHSFKKTNFSSDERYMEPVAIIGAGDVGAQLAQTYLRQPNLGKYPVAFLDDDRKKWGHRLHGIPVHGGPDWLLRPGFPGDLRRVIIAIPNASRKRLREIVEMMEGRNLKLEIVPSIESMLDGRTALSQLRPIEISDLLGREPAHLDSSGIRQILKGQVVAVTGAGGSIGSELCRQILGSQPEKLLLIEQSEAALFLIEQELIALGFKSLIEPIVADICDDRRVAKILAVYKPSILFHAAAHKHVPMMESQPAEAIKNNAIGTAKLAIEAQKAGVSRFILISTDKAINPTNVMGASKRMAEIFIQDLASKNNSLTRFISVRFGNVLGSSGSVIPTFQKQIAAGGPVKVTHPDVTRYFMTIPEAVGLVLQSAYMGNGGEIFLLDMGTPVKIVDLARSLIRLHGFKPDHDIAIEYTGLRPGEKMFEELNYDSESASPTEHPKIFRLSTTPADDIALSKKLRELESIIFDIPSNEIKSLMVGFVPEYKPDTKAGDTPMPQNAFR